MIRPYRGTVYERTGEELLDIFDAVEPQGLKGASEVSERWAERLGIDGWFGWTPARGSGAGSRPFWET